MDPERVPPLPQFETSPVHSLDKDTSGIIQHQGFSGFWLRLCKQLNYIYH